MSRGVIVFASSTNPLIAIFLTPGMSDAQGRPKPENIVIPSVAPYMNMATTSASLWLNAGFNRSTKEVII